jgi:hypothetical protein
MTGKQHPQRVTKLQAAGFDPTTFGFGIHCSTAELHLWCPIREEEEEEECDAHSQQPNNKGQRRENFVFIDT